MLLTALTTWTMLSSVAFGGCKVTDVQSFDGSSGVQAYAFNNVVLGSAGVISSGSNLTLHLAIGQVGDLNAPIEAGRPVKLRLADGTIIELSASEPVVPKATIYADAVLSIWNPKFPVTTDQLTALAGQEVVAMELPLVGQALTIDSSTRIARYYFKKNQKAAACWLAQDAA
jgi:hypothetical protein